MHFFAKVFHVYIYLHIIIIIIIFLMRFSIYKYITLSPSLALRSLCISISEYSYYSVFTYIYNLQFIDWK